MLELAGIPTKPEIHNDGVSLVDLLKSPSCTKERSLHWHYPHYHGSGWTPGGAIRKGDWKLIEFWEHGDAQLYNLAQDLGEQKDLSKKHPDIKAELAADLEAWRKKMGAVMPKRVK